MYVCLYILWKNLSIEECTFMRLYGNLSMYVRMYVCTMISRRFPLSSIMLFYVMLFFRESNC